LSYDAHANLAYSRVVVAPSPASSGTTLRVRSGEGALFPIPPFNATVFPQATIPTLLNSEIVRVIAIVGDVLTIIRHTEGSSTRSILFNDQIIASITMKTLTDIETAVDNKQPLNAILTSIVGLTPSDDDILQRKSGTWSNRTLAQVRTDLAVVAKTGDSMTGPLAIDSSSTFSAGLTLYSNNGDLVVDNNSYLLNIHLDNPDFGSGTIDLDIGGVNILNDTPQTAVHIVQTTELGHHQNALSVHSESSTKQTMANQGLINFRELGALSTNDVLEIQNDGTGDAIYVNQNGNGRGVVIEADGSTASGLYVQGKAAWASSSGLIRGILPLGATGVLQRLEHAGSGNILNLINTGTGQSLNINHNGTGTGLFLENKGSDAGFIESFVSKSTFSGTGTSAAHRFGITGASATGENAQFHTVSTGINLNINTDNSGWAIYDDHDVTNKDWSAGSVRVFATHNISDGNAYTKSGSIIQFNSDDSITSGSITNSAILLDINQNGTTPTGHAVDIQNTGTGNGLFINQDGNGVALNIDSESTTQSALYLDAGAAFTSAFGAMRLIVPSGASGTGFRLEQAGSGTGLLIAQDGAGKAIFIDNNNTNRSLDIDQDASSASSITGFSIDVDNASTGGAVAIDVANVTATGGSVIGLRIAAPSGGATNLALHLSDTGGTAAGGLTLGSDTNLYRSAANTLKTDDALIVTGALTLTSALTVGNGGTGLSSLTAYALLAGGTTSTGATQQVSGLGTSGQVLTSNGASALPTWQTAASGFTRSISSISSPTTAGSTANTDYVYFVTGTTTLTLPTAVGNTNRYSVTNFGTNTVTVATSSSQTINGSTTITMPAGMSVDVISNNANWAIF
jgi:hypothetical protein